MGRIVILIILVAALIAGVALYYLQVYAYYDEVQAQVDNVQLTAVATGQPEPILFENFKAIDSNSSPLRYRACFETQIDFDALAAVYVTYQDAEPRVAPAWFDCFDAQEIGSALEEGHALAFLGTQDVQFGIDRVIAVFPDGRAFAWHQINICGEYAFDGKPAPAKYDCFVE